ncbi:hypothetical protein [Muricomes intestini]|uniref:hypothetical protein n=1 Tax=Muricomes intestini TaxID=1796634 RepID=UPI002FDDC578
MKRDGIDTIIAEFVEELITAAPEEYLEIKLILNAGNAGKPVIARYLDVAFTYIENHRPLLIEMKGGIRA